MYAYAVANVGFIYGCIRQVAKLLTNVAASLALQKNATAQGTDSTSDAMRWKNEAIVLSQRL